MRKRFFVVFVLWIDYIGLTVIEQKDIIWQIFQMHVDILVFSLCLGCHKHSWAIGKA
jgi:hypothetical protein